MVRVSVTVRVKAARPSARAMIGYIIYKLFR